MPCDESKDILLEVNSGCGTKKIIIRKDGDDVWIETWSKHISAGMQQSFKLSTVCSKVYADVVFGSITWARDLSKVAFIGETPAKIKFTNPWDMPEKVGDDQNWHEDKFLYKEDFGELMTGKSEPALFVYDLIENRV